MSTSSKPLNSQVKSLLRKYNLTPSKGLGQNLLVDNAVLDGILAAANLSRDDVVLEIGPGLGLLTRRLAERTGRVVAVELDRKMVELLRQELAGHANVRIVEGDILETDILSALVQDEAAAASEPLSYKVVANLPYYITSAALRHLLAARVQPELMVVMVQDEVAERITAKPGRLSLLALSVQVYARAEVVLRVPASAFYPEPTVESAVVRMTLREQPAIAPAYQELFFKLAKAGFAQKRKQLHNSLSATTHLAHEEVLAALQRAGIDPLRRAETLTLEEWAALCAAWPQAEAKE